MKLQDRKFSKGRQRISKDSIPVTRVIVKGEARDINLMRRITAHPYDMMEAIGVHQAVLRPRLARGGYRDPLLFPSKNR